VRVGDVVSVFDRRDDRGSDDQVVILDQRDGVIAAFKPAWLSTIADHHGVEATLLKHVATSLGVDVETLHATSRLDVGVSGVVLLATTQAARERLTLAREKGGYSRVYVAIASGVLAVEQATWDEPIGRAADPRLRKVRGKDPVPAITVVKRVATARASSLLRLEPGTGRTHQLRVHCAHHGHALLGDAAYRGPTRVTSGDGSVRRLERISLHAWQVATPDARGAPWVVRAPIPDELRDTWARVDGDASVWDQFVSR
jgi:23S rRNA pseudouridine1911/1915/1917 synthase